ncbi:annexin-2 receptor [Lemur catta]|uniref:annexin-2 receptor n=1 Tax=Lemur catta TaxID=9447 RepID=UPI001E26E802|nr:annexin-2 receptor [Lemur catta]
MEPRFLGLVSDVLPSPVVAPEPQPAPILQADDRATGPLPSFDVEGEPPLDGCHSGLLSSPCWRLRWEQNLYKDLFPRVLSTWELRVEQPTKFWGFGKSDAAGGELDLAEESDILVLQQLPLACSPRRSETQRSTQTSDGETCDGETMKTSDGRHLCKCECCQSSDPNSWSCLEWIRRIGYVLFFVPWRCCLRICGTTQP